MTPFPFVTPGSCNCPRVGFCFALPYTVVCACGLVFGACGFGACGFGACGLVRVVWCVCGLVSVVHTGQAWWGVVSSV